MVSSSCSYCGSDKFLSFGKGIDRAIEEIGKQFPNTVIEKFSGDSKKYIKGEIVVATYGDFPLASFGAVAALDFERYGYQNTLRSSELSRKTLFNIRSLEPRDFYLDVEQGDYFAQVMQIGDSYRNSLNELSERDEALLPPNYRIAIIDCDAKAVNIFKEQPFIDSVSFAQGRAVIKCRIERASEMSNFLQGVARYRSLKRLKPWNVKIDPLDI
jgi:primosomal protein N'